MPKRIPGPSTPSTDLHPAPHESPGTDLRPGPPNRPAPAVSGFDRLKRRVAGCLPCGGTPDGAEASSQASMRLRLPLPGEGRAQPAPDQLLWPNGRQSAGHVLDTPEGPVFTVASRRKDPVLAKRGRHKPAQPRDNLPATLPVVARPEDPSGRQFVPRLAQVVTAQDFSRDSLQGPIDDRSVRALLHVAGTPVLERIVQECGATGNGLCEEGAVALKHLLGFSLRAVASECTDPRAVAQAAQALQAPHCELTLHCHPDPKGQGEPRIDLRANFDAATTRTTLAALSAGAIWHVQVIHITDGATPSHSLGLALQKQADGRLRLSVINSNGWPTQARARGAYTPGVFKTLSPDEAVAAMQDLLSGGVPPRPADMSMRDWNFPALGRPLLAWLKSAGPADAGISTDFRGTGRPLVSSPQKTGDCTSESLFAFLATVLPPADYKLAKATCLNTLVQICDQLEPPQTAAANSPLQKARQRLQERITASLSGSMVASAPQAPGG